MRIYEITDKNKTILVISNINTDFDTEFNSLISLLNLLIRLKSPSRNSRALTNIKDFENRVNLFLENKILDKTDPDIIELLEKLNKMQRHINDLRSQLIL